MQVKPYDGITRFLVQSSRLDDQDQPIEYLVDLVAYRGIGQCSCAHFSYRLEPAIGRIIPIQLRDQFRCRHINAARDYLAGELLEAMIRNELTKEKHERSG